MLLCGLSSENATENMQSHKYKVTHTHTHRTTFHTCASDTAPTMRTHCSQRQTIRTTGTPTTHTPINKDLPLQSCHSKPHQFSFHVSHWSLSKGHRWSRQSWPVSWGCQCRSPCSTVSWGPHPHGWHCESVTEKIKSVRNHSKSVK